MSAQHKITKRQKLLDENGYLTEPGYATSLILEYNRNDIKAKKFRIKEWDYYYIGNKNYGMAMTVADNSYMSLISMVFLNFDKASYISKTVMVPFTFGKLNMPSMSSEGVVKYANNRIDIQFVTKDGIRTLECSYKNFEQGKDLMANIKLSNEPQDSMVIATPFAEDKKAFYYNQKINCMKSEGIVKIGEDTYDFSTPETLGVLDWGRGVWTYDNTWYWGSLSTLLPNGKAFGFNIGYGFGDTSAASENMLFYEGKAHKLSQVKFHIPTKDGKDDFLSPWKFTSDDNRLELDFEPVVDRSSFDNVIIIKSEQHQVFGKFNGKAVLDDGTVIELKDALGFAEKVHNKF